ncbi:MAG: XTP/dITP diphosphohydrolase [Methylophilaceae bacterium]|jgi:XTP/dITP diphosphohydrolase|tara:strand:+ start:21997 stop:22593 length:597 start_codon:yes stop_codon:yes gene_type:complete
MFNKLVIASGNQGKLREIQAMLAPLNIEVVPQSDFNVSEAPEPHCTFIENALAKARHASLATQLPALADDSGLCLEALNGEPGVQSAYFSGIPSNDANNNAHLIKALAFHENRAAYYYCCLVLVRRHDDPQPLIAEGVWHGSMLKEARGSNGFGYDPLFLDDMTGKASAELSPEIKNKVSHRGQALRKMLHLIEHLTY